MSASNLKSIWLMVVLIAVLPAASAAPACTVTAGLGGFQETRSHYAYDRWLSGWWIGPVEVKAEADAGYWAKELRLLKRADLDEPLTLVEVLKVGAGFSWTGWQERFLSDNWDWTFGRAYVLEADGFKRGQFLQAALGSPFVTGSISPGAGSMNFTFENPLDDGSWLVILNKFIWTGEDPDCRPRSVWVAQSPVPIPGAIWLLGSGILGLVVVRRRAVK